MNIGLIVELISTFASAISTISSSDAGKSIEQVIKELIDHNTPGKPSSPALSG